MSDLPKHVRILGDQDLLDLLHNEEDLVYPDHRYDPEGARYWSFQDEALEPPDVWNESTDTERSYTLTVGFNAQTGLEVDLAVSAIASFIERRTTLEDVIVTLQDNNPTGGA